MKLGAWVCAVMLVWGGVACGGEPAPTPDAGIECTRVCDDGVFCNGLERCEPDAESADEAGCVRGAPPCGPSACDDAADTCDVDCATPDADGDGDPALACGGGDCDDADPRISSRRTEVCDEENLDEDCDPGTVGGRDVDEDDAVDARCCNGSACGNDCDDARPNVNPTTTEVCDGFDNDCDGSVDEGVLGTFYRDADGDDFGTPSETFVGCVAPDGFARTSTDCDDSNAGRNPGLTEVCDDVDNDCDEDVDEGVLVTFYRDADGDDFGTPSETVVGCSAPEGFARTSTDCDDANRGRNPGLAEVCDAIPDNDCNPATNPFDADGDGHDRVSCGGTDCDDTDDTVYLGAPELCDRRDNACNVGGGVLASEDADSDGHAPLGAACTGGLPKDDCDDTRADVFLGAEEVCSGRDEDCDGSVDEDPAAMASCNRTGTVGACVSGACTIAACMSPYANCNGIANDGCEANLDTSTSHCGGCDVACAAGASCVGRSCRCPVGMVVCGGACVDLQTDARHCGACGDACPFGATCEASTCQCPFGWILCGGECVDPNSDVRHCGGCGATCFGGSCAGGSCECPGAVGQLCSGECFDLSVDLDHCGACDEGCRGGSCAGGACSCPPMRPTVCEGTCTNTITDAGNCGGCGRTCGVSGTCLASACDMAVNVSAGAAVTCVERAGGGLALIREEVSSRGTVSGISSSDAFVYGCLLVGDEARCGESTVVDDVVQLEAYWLHACALRRDGRVWCWGDNVYGQCGADTPSVSSPHRVEQLTGVVEISVGSSITCARTDDGGVWCWGDNGSGQLGIGSGGPLATNVPTRWNLAEPANAIWAMSSNVCARTTSGAVWCAGVNNHAQISTTAPSGPVASPTRAEGFDGADEIGGGYQFMCARFGGRVRCRGANYSGFLGNGTFVEGGFTDVVDLTDAVKLSVGSSHSCVLRATGNVVCWGRGDRFGRTFDQNRPISIPGLP